MSKETSAPSAEALAAAISSYLKEHPTAVVKQSGIILFAMDTVECTVAADYRRCSIYIWSEMLNMRRTVVGAEHVKGCLRLSVSRLGLKKPEVLWITPCESSHEISAKDAARLRYAALLKHVLSLHSFEAELHPLLTRRAGLLTLRSCGAYMQGLLGRGQQRWAFIAIGSQEHVTSVNAILRAGLIYLSKCRMSATSKVTAGLKVIVPPGRAELMRLRVAWLADSFPIELYEFDETEKQLTRIWCERTAPCSPEIMPCFHQQAVIHRSLPALAELLQLLPMGAARRIDLQPLSPTYLSVRLFGLEFASVQYGRVGSTFELRGQLYYRSGNKNLALVGEEAKKRFGLRMIPLFHDRSSDGTRNSALYRTHADAWLAKCVRESLTEFDTTIQPNTIYRNVSSSTGGVEDVIDLLAISRTGRLIIINVRADDKMILPMHGLDQWIRLRALNRTGELRRAGYFPHMEISESDPKLIFMAPALRLHQGSELVLGYFPEQIEWSFVGLSERWREACQIVFRKKPANPRQFVKRPYAS